MLTSKSFKSSPIRRKSRLVWQRRQNSSKSSHSGSVTDLSKTRSRLIKKVKVRMRVRSFSFRPMDQEWFKLEMSLPTMALSNSSYSKSRRLKLCTRQKVPPIGATTKFRVGVLVITMTMVRRSWIRRRLILSLRKWQCTGRLRATRISSHHCLPKLKRRMRKSSTQESSSCVTMKPSITMKTSASSPVLALALYRHQAQSRSW